MNAGGVVKACKSNGLIRVLALLIDSGKRVSNTWVISPIHKNNFVKAEVILDGPNFSMNYWVKVYVSMPEWDEPAAYQLVGKVMAYQGNDG